jgi:hypothetical protein
MIPVRAPFSSETMCPADSYCYDSTGNLTVPKARTERTWSASTTAKNMRIWDQNTKEQNIKEQNIKEQNIKEQNIKEVEKKTILQFSVFIYVEI